MYSHKIKIIPILLTVFIVSCGEKKETGEFAARVEKDLLRQSYIDSVLTTPKYRNYFKEEYINKWVHDKLLYKEAVKGGILESDEYKNVLRDIKEETAVALYINKLNEGFDLSYSQDDLKNFYMSNQEEFRCGDDAYVINEIKFVSQDRAIQFRLSLLENGWDNAVRAFKDDPTIRSSFTKKYSFANELQPYEIHRLVVNMQNNDVSILTETEPGVFTIVQLVMSYVKGSIPQFEHIENNVKVRFLMIKRRNQLDNIIEGLYSKYDIEIKKDK